MAKEEALSRVVEEARERIDYVLRRLRGTEQPRSLRWRCSNCSHIKNFTRPMPAEIAPPCPKCGGGKFIPV